MKNNDLLDESLARPVPTPPSEEEILTRSPVFSTASLISLWVAVLGWSYPQFYRMLGFTELEDNLFTVTWRFIGETMVIPAILLAILLQLIATRRNERMTMVRALLFLAIPASVVLFVIVVLFFAFTR